MDSIEHLERRPQRADGRTFNSFEKAYRVNIALSYLMPIRNGQQRLWSDVRHVLDALAELTPAFELALIDDGSMDDTIVEARDIARQYPQVRAFRLTFPQGMQGYTQLGLRETTGEYLIIQNPNTTISVSELNELWSLRYDQKLVMVQSPSDSADPQQRFGGLKMIRRSAIQRLSRIDDPQSKLDVAPMHRRAGWKPHGRPQYLVRLDSTAAL